MRSMRQLIREEFYGFQPRLMLVRLLVAPLPQHTCARLRTRILRLAGFKIGFGMAPRVGAVMADLVLEGRDAVPQGFRVEDSL